jgi:hypothetical protein
LYWRLQRLQAERKQASGSQAGCSGQRRRTSY